VTDREKLGARLDPALRAWADRVIIPALAREFLSERAAMRIAKKVETVAEFQSKTVLSAEVTS
jgi:hypothetical protein